MTETATKVEKIDAHRALELLRQAVDEKGEDYVYEDYCEYWNHKGARPGCIVGHALYYAGVDVWDLPNVMAMSLVNEGLTEGAKKVFQIAQSVQDNRGCWGAAARAARDAFDCYIITKDDEE